MILSFSEVVLLIIYLLSLYFMVFWFLVFLSKNEKNPEKKVLRRFPLVTVVIPAYNEEKTIRDTILSVLNLDYPKDKVKLIVVNDGSIDKTQNIVESTIKEKKEFDIKLINQENSGKGAALNVALGIASGEFFICLDADSSPREDALKKILPYFVNENIAAVLPLLKVKDSKRFLHKVQKYEYLINMFYKFFMGKLDCINVCPGPFSVYRKDVIQKVGGFDEGNLTEDLEITLRLQKYNYKIIQIFDTEVYTIPPSSLVGMYKQRNRWYKGSVLNTIKHRNMLFNKKYGDFGIIKMPTMALTGFFALVIILMLLKDILIRLVDFLINLSYINFDIIAWISNFKINFHFLDLDFSKITLLLVLAFISLTVLKYSHRYTNEKIFRNKREVFSLAYYILIYSLFLGIVWLGIAIDLIRGKKQRW